MFHLHDGRRPVRLITAVARARRPGIHRCRQFAQAIEPVTAQAQEQFRVAFQPANMGAQGHVGRSGGPRRGERRADAVDLVITAFDGADMVGLATAEPFGGFEAGLRFGTFRRPTASSVSKVEFAIKLTPVEFKHLNIIDETLPCPGQQNLQFVGRHVAIINRAGGGNGRPGGLVGFVAIGPIAARGNCPNADPPIPRLLPPQRRATIWPQRPPLP